MTESTQSYFPTLFEYHKLSSYSRENNEIDGYAGLGTGINANNVRLEGFVKARQIDGDIWDIPVSLEAAALLAALTHSNHLVRLSSWG